MNINQFTPKNVNVEKPLENVFAGTGTYRDICEKVYDGTIYPLVKNDGTVVGLGYETGLAGAEDSIELMKFQKRYSGKPIMQYFETALRAKYEGKSLEEALTLCEKTTRSVREECAEDTTPSDLSISKEALNNDTSLRNIKSYLRRTYGRYLSGNSESELQVKETEDAVEVSNIAWGRKI